MKKTTLHLALFCLIFTFLSCGRIVGFMYGVRPRVESKTTQNKFLLKHGIDTAHSYQFNSQMKDSISTIKYNLDTIEDGNFSPLQFRVYNNTGEFIGGWAMCYVNNLKRTEILDSFPIKMDGLSHIPFNYKLNLKNDLKLVENSPTYASVMADNPDVDILVFWSRSLGKFNRDMLQELKKYMGKKTDKNIFFVKVNFSNLFSKD